jgi:hypothetical protein
MRHFEPGPSFATEAAELSVLQGRRLTKCIDVDRREKTPYSGRAAKHDPARLKPSQLAHLGNAAKLREDELTFWWTWHGRTVIALKCDPQF